MAILPPYRFRGYRFDTETGLYYLQSRYYDANVGRFLNEDDLAILALPGANMLVTNLYTYCYNNPAIHSDPTGMIVVLVIAGIAITTAQAIVLASMLIFSVSYTLNIGGFRTSVNNAVNWAINNIITTASRILRIYSQLGVWAAGVIADLVAVYASDAAKSLPGIAGKYDNFECEDAAEAMKAELIKRRLRGAIVDLVFPNAYRGFVVSNRLGWGTAISHTGHHFGVYYKGNIYCNIYPEGIPAGLWPEKFHAASDAGRMTIYNWF
jgi:RHS repeat-associated protein